MKHQIAFIGVGIMGSGIIKNLQKHNISLSLYARNPQKIMHLKNESTSIFLSPEECVENSTHTILCLTEDSVVRDIYEKISNRIRGILIDFGTTSPSLTKHMFTDQRDKGNIFIASPMTGSKSASEQGQIVYMIGAESETIIQNHLFLWEYTGKKIIFCGTPEDAQRAKISLNLTQALILQSYIEGSILAESTGISPALYKEIVYNSAARSGISDFKLQSIEDLNFSPNFSLKNMNKDINHALSEAVENHLSLPLSFALKSVYNEGMKKKLGDEDFVSLYKINKNRNDSNLE